MLSWIHAKAVFKVVNTKLIHIKSIYVTKFPPYTVAVAFVRFSHGTSNTSFFFFFFVSHLLPASEKYHTTTTVGQHEPARQQEEQDRA